MTKTSGRQLGLWDDPTYESRRARHFKQPQPDYLTYLDSAKWQLRRGEAIERADFQCQDCGCWERLQVHHSDYRNLGYEEASDLEVLCPPCHVRRHERNLTPN